MAEQHRATAGEWASVKVLASGGSAVAYSCILELLHRIEALEAAQHAHLIDPEREKVAQELSQDCGFAPRYNEFELCAAIIEASNDAKPVDSPHQPNHPAKPDGSLVERVANAMNGATEWQARAAIREVAAWLRKHYGGSTVTSHLLEKKAER